MILTHKGVNVGTVISHCEKYRYVLTRKTKVPLRWVKKCLFIMLNPSIADAYIDDPTIKRCISFAEREGCTELTVVNLFALRSTDPKLLLKIIKEDPILASGGVEAESHLLEQIKEHCDFNHLIICGWGKQVGIKSYGDRVIETIVEYGGVPLCLGKTKDGYPRHPLYIKKDKQLEDAR